MTNELKQFLVDNKNLLTRNDFDGIYKKAISELQSALIKELTEFLYNLAQVDPLKYMSSIPQRMFFGVVLSNELVVPANIKLDSLSIKSMAVPTLRLQCDLVSKCIVGCSFNNVIIDSEISKIPSNCFYSCTIEKVRLPETVLRIGNDAFGEISSVKIITPYRDNPQKRLIVPKNEVQWYKDHLKFTHAPKESEEEVQGE